MSSSYALDVKPPKRGDFFNDRSMEIRNGNNTNNADKIKQAEAAKNILLNAASGASVATNGVMGQLINRRVQFIKYRKPHTIEYPANAVVLNPKHVNKQRAELSKDETVDTNTSENGLSSPTNTAHSFIKANRNAHQEDCNDDPRVRELPEILCSEEVFHRNLQLTWKSVGAGCGAGLVNCGNTCFANSVLQCFAFTTPFAQFLMSNFQKPNTGPDVPFDYAFALAETIRLIHANKGKAIKPGLIIGNLKGIWKGLVLGKQCDSFEFGQQLITKVQESVLRRMIGTRKVPFMVQHTTPFMRVAGGYERSQVSWSKMDEIDQLKKAKNSAAAADLAMDKALKSDKMVSNTYEHFTMLTLAVVAGNTLETCLKDYYKREKLDGRIYTTQRKVKVIAHRQISLHIPPPSLMIHLKRFDNSRTKINKPISFPKALDMLPYCSPNSDVKEALYDLCAVTVHIGGSINYGHYVAYIKGKNGLWYLCDDESVRQVGEAEVLRAQSLIVYYSMRESSFKKLTIPTPLLGPTAPPTFTEGENVPTKKAVQPSKQTEDGGVELSEDQIQKALLATKERMLKQAEQHEREAERERLRVAMAQKAKKERDDLPTESDTESEDDNANSQRPTKKETTVSMAPISLPPSVTDPPSLKQKGANNSVGMEQQTLSKKAAAAIKARTESLKNVYNNDSEGEDSDNIEDDNGDEAASDEEAEDSNEEVTESEASSSDDEGKGSSPSRKAPLQPPRVSPKFAPIISALTLNSKKASPTSPLVKSQPSPVTKPETGGVPSTAVIVPKKTATVSKGPLPSSLSKFANLMGVIRQQQLIKEEDAAEEKAAADQAAEQLEAASSSTNKKEPIRANVFAPKTNVRTGEEVRRMRIKRSVDEDEEDENAPVNNSSPHEEQDSKEEIIPYSREAYERAMQGENLDTSSAAHSTIDRKRHQGIFKKHLRDEEWAAEFDRGKQKKVRTEQREREDLKFCKPNSFQVAQNQKTRGEFVPKYRPSDEEKRAMRAEARRGGGGGGDFGSRGGFGGGGRGGSDGWGRGRGGNNYNGGNGAFQSRRSEGSKRITFE